MRYYRCKECGRMKTLSEMKGVTGMCRDCWHVRNTYKKRKARKLDVLKSSSVKANKSKKVQGTFTLSVYHQGMHRTEGNATPEEVKWNTLSFAESEAPLGFMINEFHKFPLGTRIKVTMEVVKS